MNDSLLSVTFVQELLDNWKIFWNLPTYLLLLLFLSTYMIWIFCQIKMLINSEIKSEKAKFRQSIIIPIIQVENTDTKSISKLLQTPPNFSKLLQTPSKLFQTLSTLVQTLSKCVQTCPNVSKCVQMHPNASKCNLMPKDPGPLELSLQNLSLSESSKNP